MNYLAHAYLSFGNEPVLIGNMISDFVKGNKNNTKVLCSYKLKFPGVMSFTIKNFV